MAEFCNIPLVIKEAVFMVVLPFFIQAIRSASDRLLQDERPDPVFHRGACVSEDALLRAAATKRGAFVIAVNAASSGETTQTLMIRGNQVCSLKSVPGSGNKANALSILSFNWGKGSVLLVRRQNTEEFVYLKNPSVRNAPDRALDFKAEYLLKLLRSAPNGIIVEQPRIMNPAADDEPQQPPLVVKGFWLTHTK